MDQKKAEECVAYYLDEMHKGKYENAFHSLAESPPEVLHVLGREYFSVRDPMARAVIVGALSEASRHGARHLYLSAVNDSDPAVREAALKALLTVGTDLVDEFRSLKRSVQCRENPELRKAVDEAFEQLKEHITRAEQSPSPYSSPAAGSESGEA